MRRIYAVILVGIMTGLGLTHGDAAEGPNDAPEAVDFDTWMDRCESDWALAEAYTVTNSALRAAGHLDGGRKIAVFDQSSVKSTTRMQMSAPCTFRVVTHLRGDSARGFVVDLERNPAQTWPYAWTIKDIRSW